MLNARANDAEMAMGDRNIPIEDFELKTADTHALVDDAGAVPEAVRGRFVAKYGQLIAR